MGLPVTTSEALRNVLRAPGAKLQGPEGAQERFEELPGAKLQGPEGVQVCPETGANQRKPVQLSAPGTGSELRSYDIILNPLG